MFCSNSRISLKQTQFAGNTDEQQNAPNSTNLFCATYPAYTWCRVKADDASAYARGRGQGVERGERRKEERQGVRPKGMEKRVGKPTKTQYSHIPFCLACRQAYYDSACGDFTGMHTLLSSFFPFSLIFVFPHSPSPLFLFHCCALPFLPHAFACRW